MSDIVKVNRRNDPVGVRSRIVDGAEALLARRGYHGVTTREVAAEAGVNLGTLTYHFATKDELFRHVITRRAGEYIRRTDESLNAALAAESPPSVEAVLRAYIAPSLELSLHGGPGWKNYMRLLGAAMNHRQDEAFLAPVLENFNPLLQRIVQAFSSIYPDADESDINWSLFFVEAAFIHILTEAGVVDRHGDGRYRSADLETILARMIPFFAAGFREGVRPRALRERAS